MKIGFYEIKGKAENNYKSLYDRDKKIFYWNVKQFKNLDIGEHCFIYNYNSGEILFSQVTNKDIKTEYDSSNDITIVDGNDKKYKAKGEWKEEFIKFKVLDSKYIGKNSILHFPNQASFTYLCGKSNTQNSETIDNNVKKIQTIRKIFDNNANITEILEQCSQNIQKKVKTDYKNIEGEKIDLQEIDNLDDPLLKKIFIAAKTKPFIILAGLSGTGKSTIARKLAYLTCPEKLRENDKPGNFEIIPVKPNWHDSLELLGYITRINGEKYVATKLLKFIAKSWKHLDVPFFLCLDEMNLAPVEHYFAEYLSIIETRRKDKMQKRIVTDYIISKNDLGERLYHDLLKELELDENSFNENIVSTNVFKDGIGIPENLITVGTVNMDETTQSFSKKVLDRAMTVEINDIDLKSNLKQEIWEYKDFTFKNIIGKYIYGGEVAVLSDFSLETNKILNYLSSMNDNIFKNTPFMITYRIRDEVLIYSYYYKYYSKESSSWICKALDDMVFMKILPKIEGDEEKTKEVIEGLKKFLKEPEKLLECSEDKPEYKFNNSIKKLEEMEKKLINFGYTSFWL